ncbi:protein of unknown function [Chitinophaga terrae (ex Kim and Jung 2007)]|uniref:DUF4349 domain-containing protein n=1 Tax=Chitinophaga terrae (ex Kim and Jung 2007) TaxID=408074 RepID=A0A1H4B5B8_9BACT|nr:DUF4349 domain-containing protein [Chitinophaga terrae (ex Kim and Jung 2007)]SEA43445.1 protein of unknown function [Chitinophaga terrae (ex Kim and Jung 2007)]
MNTRTYLICMLFLFPACMKSTPKPEMTAKEIAMPAPREEERVAAQSDDIAPAIASKVIQTANVSFETDAFNKCRVAVNDVIKKYGGQVTNEKQDKGEYSWRSETTAKVPANKLDSALNALEGIAGVFNEKTVNTEDVTKQYIDMDARMRTQQALEQRYLQLLQKAGTVGDMLEIEEKLSQVRAVIEAAKTNMKQIDDQVAYSTLTINYWQVMKNSSLRRPGFASQAWDSVKDGWDAIVATVLGLIAAWPFIIVAVIIFIFVRRWRKNRRLRKQVASHQ